MSEKGILCLYDGYLNKASKYYKKFKEIDKKISCIVPNAFADALLSGKDVKETKDYITEEVRTEYFRLLNEGDEYLLIAVLFEAFAVESFLNSYGARRLGKSFYKEHLERLEILDKCVVVFKLATGEDFPKSKNIYQKLQELVSARNNLVHSKGVTIDSTDITAYVDGYSKLLGNKGKDLSEIASSVIGTCKELIALFED